MNSIVLNRSFSHPPDPLFQGFNVSKLRFTSTTETLKPTYHNWVVIGIGEAVLSALAEAGALPAKFKHLAVPRVPHSGKADELLEKFGISASHVVEAVNAL